MIELFRTPCANPWGALTVAVFVVICVLACIVGGRHKGQDHPW